MVYNWHKIEEVSLAALPDNKLLEVKAGDKRIGLLKKNERVLAFAAACPHASGNLCEGWVDNRGNVVCPVHGYRFDPANGRNTSGEGYKLFTYAVEIKGDEIFVGIIP